MARVKQHLTEPSMERKNNPFIEKEKPGVDGLMAKFERVVGERSRNVFESLNNN
jgi:hypothetical protein